MRSRQNGPSFSSPPPPAPEQKRWHRYRYGDGSGYGPWHTVADNICVGVSDRDQYHVGPSPPPEQEKPHEIHNEACGCFTMPKPVTFSGSIKMGQDSYPPQAKSEPAPQARLAEAVEIIRWALGEEGEFPDLPDDWPKRKFYWRTELREKAEHLLNANKGEKP